MLARGGAGVADPCADGSAVFYNPAALALQRSAAAAGVVVIDTDAEFTFDATRAEFESTQPLAWVPHAFVSVRANERLAVAIGAGVALLRGDVRIRRRIDLATTGVPGTDLTFAAIGVPAGTDCADARLDADDWAATFHLGAAGRVGERLRLGARYLH